MRTAACCLRKAASTMAREQALTRLSRLHCTHNTLFGPTCTRGTLLTIPTPHHSVQARHYGGASSKLHYASSNKQSYNSSNNHNNKPQHAYKNYDRPFKHVVVPGAISPRRPIPPHIPCPTYANTEDGRVKPHAFEGPFEIKGAASIQGMREACALARKILDFAGTLVKVLTLFISSPSSPLSSSVFCSFFFPSSPAYLMASLSCPCISLLIYISAWSDNWRDWCKSTRCNHWLRSLPISTQLSQVSKINILTLLPHLLFFLLSFC